MKMHTFPANRLAGIFILVIVTAITQGCASGPYPVTSPYYQIPPGSQLVLHQALTIPANRARVYLQYGRVVSEKDKDRYQPNCWFLSWKLMETHQNIEPDTFVVVRSAKAEDYVKTVSNIKLASRSIRVESGSGASIGISSGTGVFGGDAPMATVFTTQLFIQSDKQPDIQMLECSHWDDPSSGEHLTVQQIQDALGSFATLQIPQ